MAIAKVIEISSASAKSFDDAITAGIERAGKTVHEIKGAWIKEQSVKLEDGKIVEYRVDMKLTFVLEK